jgi:hypothetical protein
VRGRGVKGRRKGKHGVIPIYAVVKCTGNLIPCIRTKRKVEIIRVKNEFKFLYKKKQNLNMLLYKSGAGLAQAV